MAESETSDSGSAVVAPHQHDLSDITGWPEPDDADAPGTDDDDTPGPPYTGGNEQENPRGMDRFTAKSATRRGGFPAGSGAARSMDALRGRR